MMNNNIIFVPTNKIPNFNDYIYHLFANPNDDFKYFAPKSITLQLTDDCNLQCSYCYQNKKQKHLMDFKVAQNFIDKLLTNEISTEYINSKNNLGVIIDFIGGEPFLAVELMDQIIDYYITKCLELNHPWLLRTRFSICSNGTLYFTPKVQEFIKKHQGHISLSFSVDGDKQTHDACRKFPNGDGSYDLAIAAAKHYQKYYDGYLGSKITISPENIDFLSNGIISLFNEGYEYIYANCVFENVWNKCLAQKLYYQLKNISDFLINNNLEKEKGTSILGLNLLDNQKTMNLENWCGGTGQMLAVDYKGDLFPCLRYMNSSLNDKQPEYIIGNIENGIGNTEETAQRVKELNEITLISQSEQKCLDCPISEGCAWCSGYNYEEFGTPNKRATYICDMHKARVLANYYYQNSAMKKHNVDERIPFLLQKEDALQIIPEEEYNLLISLTKI